MLLLKRITSRVSVKNKYGSKLLLHIMLYSLLQLELHASRFSCQLSPVSSTWYLHLSKPPAEQMMKFEHAVEQASDAHWEQCHPHCNIWLCSCCVAGSLRVAVRTPSLATSHV